MAGVSTLLDRATGIAEIRLVRPPHNFLDAFLLEELADVAEAMDADTDCGAIILSSDGRNFSAGRDFSGERKPGDTSEAVYAQAVRLMAIGAPMVALVQGAAVGAGFGLAMVADLRLCSDRAYFSANFVQHGLHHGFGLTTTLPHSVGSTLATEMLLTGRRYGAEESLALGLVRRVLPEDQLAEAGRAVAQSIAANRRDAVRSIRKTMRGHLREAFEESVRHEVERQTELTRP